MIHTGREYLPVEFTLYSNFLERIGTDNPSKATIPPYETSISGENVTNLTDSHGRKIRKLRLSLTDKCNLRCHYCMPVDSTFMDEKKFLKASEYTEIVSELVDLGVEELRLTGGEPLLRPAFEEIVRGISQLKLKKIGLTSNGIFLDRYLEILKENRVFHLNISLDSLDPENFMSITHGDYLDRVLENISRARKMGFVVKVNTVAMKGVNDHELENFVTYSRNTGIEVRFLELMRIGHARDAQKKQFIPAKEMIARLMERHLLKPIVKEGDSTSFNYLLDNGAQIGFIASESRPFCGQCSRWRLSADGILRACLMKDDGISIRNKTTEERIPVYQELLGMKPAMRPIEVSHQMNGIGG